ncbi:methylmalonyl-CoA mutase subunit beta [Leptospira sp. 2 VSF19]|uniref:Methylmalonyl-CoA mutase subunit beta n=1 Tax=Leptospira soteropolitanensis TaxID=2950025 RepID=A0AAW5VF55_9LEPT|nr:methylmalonyl-CoA mutase family protein [Leptospira soteropolitanensis]MCW7492422.1 methylmalonyl-CoA mutase subunit beta [Leptospira soteropolitanensis]MCW7500473.1 methylmalonyl-CoA mutase subunit beta [Leptospira soteropolitanensis]MCW7522857.1 methylmalonyl-CoA mutase subunit beta [Leptospira soteropolitanensis]MCW7526716.1 methylmalonyl-CoA mutase subunit beta [Leptospira soteropolitanensis]MCW7530443.1 methylmalonyl-CoA mutase subunit beta [Leptospira soteropolitanensis]
MNEFLFSDFREVSTEDWKNQILKDLKGSPWDKVTWETEEGFKIEPFYRKEDLPEIPRVYKRNTGWNVTEIVSSESELTNLPKKGADAVVLVATAENGKSSLKINTAADLERLASLIGNLPLVVSVGDKTPSFADSLKKLISSHNTVLGDFDPYGSALKNGELGTEENSIGKNFSVLSGTKGFAGVGIHSYYLRDAGASIGQELAYTLSWGVDYLNRHLDAGVSIEDAASNLWFWMGIGSDYFMEIAKFRAMRILWTEILNAYKPGLGESLPALIVARTSNFQFTAYDPYVNMLRGTTTAMSAVMGGADFVSVLPFDSEYSAQQELGKRIARNSQLLLRYESFLDKVEDPAAGSYYLEVLTKKLAESAWSQFQDIEKEGGFEEGLKKGTIQKEINTRAEKKRNALATKKDILLGTNQYPLPSERHPELKNSLEETKEQITNKKQTSYLRLIPVRLSYEFDKWRNLTDTHVASGKKLPKVFLLTIGDLTMRKARAGFSSNFLGCLGYEIIDNLGFASVKEGVTKAKELGCEIVVLCSSDEEYATYLPEFAAEMKSQLPGSWKLLAGYPKDLITQAESLGIDDFIHMKRNIVEFMEKAQTKWIGK